jgi:Nickel responsive protein SCO4226-like
MKKFIVERNLPGAGNLTPEELQAISKTSCAVIKEMGKPYHWIESYIADDKIYCIHIAESEEVVREHARRGRFPVHLISEVKKIIDPLTASPSSKCNNA